MAYGFKLINDEGVSYFDTSKTTWNFVAYLVQPAGATQSWTVPEISNFSEILITKQFLDVTWGGQESYIGNVSRSGTTVSASGGNMQTAIIVLGR